MSDREAFQAEMRAMADEIERAKQKNAKLEAEIASLEECTASLARLPRTPTLEAGLLELKAMAADPDALLVDMFAGMLRLVEAEASATSSELALDARAKLRRALADARADPEMAGARLADLLALSE